MIKSRQIFIVFFVFVMSISVFAHSGRTDAYGGHNNRKTGGYHYHNAGSIHTAANPYQNHDMCGICNEINQKDKITYVQKVMKDKKIYNGEITGIIDEETKSAIKKMQAEYGITQTGIITQYLLDKLVK